MSSDKATVHDPALDYATRDYIHPTYTYTKILPQAGSQAQTITTSGGQENIFELPVKAFNLARSHLAFTMVIPDSGNPNYNWVPSDCLSAIRQIQLYTRGGLFLADINEIANYTKVIWPATTPFEEFVTYDSFGVPLAAATNTNPTRMFRKSNALITTNYRANGNAADVSYDEQLYLHFSSIGGVAGSVTLTVRMPLEMIRDSILGLDKDLFFDEIINLRIVWNPTTKIYWYGSSNSNPTSGAAAANASVAISDLTFYLAVEENLALTVALKQQKQTEGIKILMPYVYTNKQSLSSTSQNVTLRYNRAHGMRLKRIYHSLFNATESANTVYDHDNATGAKVTQFYTMLNSMRLQQYNLLPASLDDYHLLQEKIKGSAILNSSVFLYNWFWLEDFCGDKPLARKEVKNVSDDNLSCGLDLTEEKKWDFIGVVTGNATYNHYTFSVTEKMLVINQEGIFLA